VENLERLGDLVEASSDADIARGAASALRRRLKQPLPDEADAQWLAELDDLLRRWAEDLQEGMPSRNGSSPQYLRHEGERDPSAGEPVSLAEIQAAREELSIIRRGGAELNRIKLVLGVVDGAIRRSLDRAWQARRGPGRY